MEFLSLKHRDQQLVKLLRPLVTGLTSIRMMQHQTIIYYLPNYPEVLNSYHAVDKDFIPLKDETLEKIGGGGGAEEVLSHMNFFKLTSVLHF